MIVRPSLPIGAGRIMFSLFGTSITASITPIETGDPKVKSMTQSSSCNAVRTIPYCRLKNSSRVKTVSSRQRNLVVERRFGSLERTKSQLNAYLSNKLFNNDPWFLLPFVIRVFTFEISLFNEQMPANLKACCYQL